MSCEKENKLFESLIFAYHEQDVLQEKEQEIHLSHLLQMAESFGLRETNNNQ